MVDHLFSSFFYPHSAFLFSYILLNIATYWVEIITYTALKFTWLLYDVFK